MSICDHNEWVYPPPAENSWTGEMEDQEPYKRSVQDDISVGAFKCRRCGEIGYYTGLWKSYYEYGVECSGSKGVSRELDRPKPPRFIR